MFGSVGVISGSGLLVGVAVVAPTMFSWGRVAAGTGAVAVVVTRGHAGEVIVVKAVIRVTSVSRAA